MTRSHSTTHQSTSTNRGQQMTQSAKIVTTCDAGGANEREAESAASRLAAMLDPNARQRAYRRGKLEEMYVTSHLNAKVELAVCDIIENVAASAKGSARKRRALVIIGESGSGKSTVLGHALLNRPELQPYINEHGVMVRPRIYFDAPKPLSLKLFARKIIEAAGHPFDTSRLREYELFELAKTVLRERQVLMVVIDEAQHLLKGNDKQTIQNLADTVKSLLQIEGWPLHLVLAGVPTLAKFLEYEPQLRNRSIVVELESLSCPADQERVRAIVKGVVEKHAEMIADSAVLNDEFVHRLVQAAGGGFGTTIELIRSACEMAIREDRDVVDRGDFAQAFSLMSGCRAEHNIFLVEDWKILSSFTSVAEIAERQEVADLRMDARHLNRKKGGL